MVDDEQTDDGIDQALRAWGRGARSEAKQVPDRFSMRQRPGRRRWPAAAGAAAAVAAIAVLATALAVGRGGTPEPLSRPTSSEAPAPVRPSPDQQQVVYARLSILVPRAWKLGDERCGGPNTDTVLLPVVIGLCRRSMPTRLTWVAFDPPQSGRRLPNIRDVVTRRVTIDGHRATEASGTVGSVPVVRAVVEGSGAIVSVYAPMLTTAQSLVDTLSVVDRDGFGCVTAAGEKPLVDIPPSGFPGTTDQLVPGRPTGIAACAYENGYLVNGMTVSSARLASVLRELRSLSPGYSVASGIYQQSCTGGDSTAARSLDTHHPSPFPWFVLRLRYSDGRILTLTARIDGCGYLGVTNGRRSGQLSIAFGDFLINATLAGGAFPSYFSPAR